MNIKRVLFSLLIGFVLLIPLSLQAQAAQEEPRLNCNVDFRILELKNEVNFNTNILGKFGFNREISRLTVQIVKIDVSEQKKAEAPMAFKWLQANAAELDFKTLNICAEEKNELRQAYKKDRKRIFTFKTQVVVVKENGRISGYAHLLGKALGGQVENNK